MGPVCFVSSTKDPEQKNDSHQRGRLGFAAISQLKYKRRRLTNPTVVSCQARRAMLSSVTETAKNMTEATAIHGLNKRAPTQAKIISERQLNNQEQKHQLVHPAHPTSS